MTKTIKNVTIVVPVLMTSCQVSDQPKNGQDRQHKGRRLAELLLNPAREAGEDRSL
jgi:hypothetical protein